MLKDAEDENIAVLERQDGPEVDPIDWSTDTLEQEKMLENNVGLKDTSLEVDGQNEKKNNEFSDLDSIYYHFQLIFTIIYNPSNIIISTRYLNKNK